MVTTGTQSKPLTFTLIGAAGFVAPRHLEAMRSVNGTLLAAHDITDSVGVMDDYYPSAAFFLDRDGFADFLARHDVDYLAVCTPTNQHEQDSLLALDAGVNVIVEKPPVLNPAALHRLRESERTSGRVVHPVLQLRYHPQIQRFKQAVAAYPAHQHLDVEAPYVARRGPWYHASWKGDPTRAGTLIYNFGIHIFDVLTWVFGMPCEPVAAELDGVGARARGTVVFERATVRWSLSTRQEDLPKAALNAHRQLLIDGAVVADYSGTYADLHRVVYTEIAAGRGHTIEDALPATILTNDLLMAATSMTIDALGVASLD